MSILEKLKDKFIRRETAVGEPDLMPSESDNTSSAAILQSGKCGDGISWTLDEEGILTIFGNGEIKCEKDERPADLYPWSPYRELILGIEVRSGIREVGNYAFYDCYNLKNVSLPKTLNRIGRNAFMYCSSIQNIVLPGRMTAIERGVFWYCSRLESIEIPDSVRSVGVNAFRDCGLQSIKLPESLATIGNYAFFGCEEIESIEIPDGVTEIGDHAFDKCWRLKYVKIPVGLMKCGKHVFGGNELEEIEMPEGLKSVGNYMVIENSGLKSVRFPASVTNIGLKAFIRCSGLQDYYVDEKNQVYCTIDGCLYSKDKKKLVRCPEGKMGSIEIPSGVTEIGEYSFSGCEKLESAVLPSGLTSIGKFAFSCCKQLKSVNIPDTVISVGQGSFYSCSSLDNICLPASLEVIGPEAFMYCKLNSIEIPETVSVPKHRNIFLGCRNQELSAFYDPLDTVQRSISNLNSELNQIACSYMNTTNSSFRFWLEEIFVPDESDIDEVFEDSDTYLEKCIKETLSDSMSISEQFNDSVQSQINGLILDLINRHESTLYELTTEGWAKYGKNDDRWTHLRCLIHLQDEPEYWYAFWTFWSD